MLRKLKWQIPGEPLAARYNWCQGRVPGRGPVVEKHWIGDVRQKVDRNVPLEYETSASWEKTHAGQLPTLISEILLTLMWAFICVILALYIYIYIYIYIYTRLRKPPTHSSHVLHQETLSRGIMVNSQSLFKWWKTTGKTTLLTLENFPVLSHHF